MRHTQIMSEQQDHGSLFPFQPYWSVSLRSLDCCPWICPDRCTLAEILLCFDVPASGFSPAVLSFLLGKLRGFRDDRLGALFVLCILINSSWQPQLADILDGVQHFADVDFADGVLLGESVTPSRGAF